MNYHLLIIGYETDLTLARDVLAAEFDHLDARFFEIGDLSADAVSQITEDLRKACRAVDGVLLLRKDIYVAVSNQMEFPVPSRYIEIEDETLVQILLRVRLTAASRLNGISVDGFPAGTLRPLLSDSDIFEEDAKVWTIPTSRCLRMAQSDIVSEHISNLEGGADVVLTCFPEVNRILREKGIPVYFVEPSANSIVLETRNLNLGVQLREEQNRLAYIYLCLRYKQSMLDLIQVPMRETDELINISNMIHLFARSIDAASFSLSRWEYVILCDESMLLQKTNSYSDISIIQKIAKESIFDALMAVGIGRTAKAAYSNAMVSYSASVKIRSTNAVVTLDDQRTLPPVIYKSKIRKDPSNAETSDVVLYLSQNSGTNYASLQKLYLASIERNSDLFTSTEISDILGISVRSANRLLQKLLDSKCASIVSSVSLKTIGRPNRLIRIHF